MSTMPAENFEFRAHIGPAAISSHRHLRGAPVIEGMVLEDLEISRSFRPDHRLLVVLQSVNAGGKDGVIEELTTLIGARNMRVKKFVRPQSGEDEADPLIVAEEALPNPGEIVVFNRSYYERPLGMARRNDPLFAETCGRINEFEDRLHMSGTILVKLFLNIDRAEQRRRLDARRRRPELRRLHNPRDYEDQERWDELISSYENLIRRTHTAVSPWLIVPANDRSQRNLVVRQILVHRLRSRPA